VDHTDDRTGEEDTTHMGADNPPAHPTDAAGKHVKSSRRSTAGERPSDRSSPPACHQSEHGDGRTEPRAGQPEDRQLVWEGEHVRAVEV